MMPSLAISSPIHIQSPTQPSQTSRSPRPRLKLNTAELFQPSTYGKGAGSGLRLETLSAVSPTVRNTFSNAYGKSSTTTSSSSPTSTTTPTPRPVRPRLAIDSSVHTSTSCESSSPNSASAERTPSSASVLSATSTDSTSSADSATVRIPYKLSYNVRSILRNSPLPSVRMSSTTCRPMFPAAKHVSFRFPLDEEIHTTTYTVPHSELELSESSTTLPTAEESTSSSTSPFSSFHSDTDSTSTASNRTLANAISDKATKPKSPARVSRLSHTAKTGDKRTSDDEDSDSDKCPETPVAGRRKKQRAWVWTLGPIDGQKVNSSDEDTELSDSNSSKS
ncbi:hypothetical protein NA57DRAFT_69286 [Rhizodiscina lignyota]|uniref:Uncharacterized protein n=1 Tax=Rhizodiscina lignyota TaxID=1504668 RepID=A0A9P4M027_9PEZI|nr:hypothetical protein NA57DRAFT_69286 [Rhizodiscina lignyota]